MASTENKQELQAIDLTKLNIPQLSQLKTQLDQFLAEININSVYDQKVQLQAYIKATACIELISEFQHLFLAYFSDLFIANPDLLKTELAVFQDSLHSLKIAQTKFQDSKESLEKLGPESKGKEIMVPLTGSMYVPGRISDSEKVLIDIGTGYFVEKDLEGAKDYFRRKVVFVTEQMEKIQEIGMGKSKVREVVVDVMQTKAQQMAEARMVPVKT